jgi:L-alanine-DL-glutamate epimerase-like enolase superfamily enzyme
VTITAKAQAAKVQAISAEAYEIPTDRPEADGTLEWSSTVMVLVRAQGGGAEGIGWTYGAAAARALIEEKLAGVVEGVDLFDVPRANEAMLRACRNLGQPGLAGAAVSAVDVALWDLKARFLGIPLSGLLGRVQDDVPVYGSGGFTSYPDDATRAQLECWIHDWELPRVKIKIGESWGRNEQRDLERVALARSAIGDATELYVDANGGYTRKQAVRMGQAMSEQYAVTWFEEPVSSDDLTGLREVRDQCPIDVAAGEYGWSPWYYAPMIVAGAVDCVQADVTRCGGITGWLAVAHLAAAHQLQISGHCAPNLHAHVALAAPNLRHLEYFHDHVRIEDMLLDGALSPRGGALQPDPSAPGLGVTFRTADAERYRVG